MGVVLRAHPVGGESHIQPNANREVATLETHGLQLSDSRFETIITVTVGNGAN